MIAKHTPGPWKAHLNALTAIIPGHIIKRNDDIALPIASVPKGTGTKGPGEQIANAHLIAAAPDLLAELVKAESFISGFEDDELQTGIKAQLRRIRRAIAKAKGASR